MIERILYNHIPVKNIPAAVKWYTKILGFKFIWHSQEERLAQLNIPSGSGSYHFYHHLHNEW